MKTPVIFLSSLLFACGSSSDSAPSVSGAGAEPEPLTMETADGGLKLTQQTGDKSPSGGPRFVMPEGWTEQPPENAMRKKQYSLAGPEGSEPALAVVAHWPHGIGDLESNLDRWVGQVGSKKRASELGAEERWVVETDKYMITHVHVEGAIKPMDGMGSDIAATDSGAILAAFIQPSDESGPWTIKVTGPSKTVAAHKDRYLAFVNGL